MPKTRNTRVKKVAAGELKRLRYKNQELRELIELTDEALEGLGLMTEYRPTPTPHVAIFRKVQNEETVPAG